MFVNLVCHVSCSGWGVVGFVSRMLLRVEIGVLVTLSVARVVAGN